MSSPVLGIIICRSKQRTIVEFALRDVSKPIGVATYTLTDTLPTELRPFFPSNEELVRRLGAVTAASQVPAKIDPIKKTRKGMVTSPSLWCD